MNNDYIDPTEEAMLADAVLHTEMTGLIPSMPENSDEMTSYLALRALCRNATKNKDKSDLRR